MKNALDLSRQTLFKATCFGPWLDLTYLDNEDRLVQYMLQKQVREYDDNYDLPMVYCVNGHSVVFGRHEFCLMTGFRFGILSFRKWRSGDIPFRDRVFPDKVGQYVKNIDLLSVIEDDDVFLNLSDVDAIRVCLLLTLEVIFMGKDLGSVIDDMLLRMVEYVDEWNAFSWGEYIWRQLYDSIRNVASKNRVGNSATLASTKSKDVPTYCLSGFVSAFKIWIIETSAKSQQWWTKDDRVIPRALSWSKHKAFGKFDNFDQLFDKESTPKLALTPTSTEADSQWYTESLEFFRWYTPRSPPVVKGGPYDDYWKKRASLKEKMSKVDSSVVVAQDVEVFALEAVVKDLVSRTLKLETIIQVLTSKRQKVVKDSNEKVYNGKREREPYSYKPGNQDNYPIKSDPEKDIGDDYCSQGNDFINMFQSPCIEVDSPNKDGLHNVSLGNLVNEEKQEDLSQPNEAKFESSPLKQLPHERYGPKKRRFENIIRSPFIEVKPAKVVSLDELKNRKNILDPTMVQMLSQVRPWIEVLDRPYANLDRIYVSYEIDRFLLMDGWPDCKFPWCGEITVDRTFWDSLIGLDDKRKGWLLDEHIDIWIAYMWHTRPDDRDWSMPEMRSFYLSMREALETRLPEVLKAADVFDQKGIDPVSYRIKFMNAEDVPRQGGLFDDCGVWVCILLFRLGNGRPLEFDNPTQAALAYRERLIKFYYKHKIHVP
ncbi:phospholipase-like protein [Artemisia annua]|uniref:Phospholipase-like protein n=1 Tax=Artemisia annua TaxID=35608 RepID=A0A2U1NW59_ARTAN|nr:phospholipase-like protein [Artemisia annua]